MSKNDINPMTPKNAWEMYLLFSQYSHYGSSPAPEGTNQNHAPAAKAAKAGFKP